MVASSWALGRDVWVDDAAPDAVDANTWCFVRVKVFGFSAAAGACAESGLVWATRRSGQPEVEHFGTLVRHGELAEQLDLGSDADVADVVNRLLLLELEDRCALAVAGPARLAAAIINAYRFAAVEWAQAMAVAIATGTDPVLAARRVSVFAALNAARSASNSAEDLETWDRHAALAGVEAVVLAIRAGYSTSEVTAETLADRATLAAAAALNARSRS